MNAATEPAAEEHRADIATLPATPLEPVDLLMYPVFQAEPMAALAYSALLPYRAPDGVLALGQARGAWRERLPNDDAWEALLRSLTRAGALQLRGLRPVLSPPHDLATLRPLGTTSPAATPSAAPRSGSIAIAAPDPAADVVRDPLPDPVDDPVDDAASTAPPHSVPASPTPAVAPSAQTPLLSRDEPDPWSVFLAQAGNVRRSERRTYRRALFNALRDNGYQVSESASVPGLDPSVHVDLLAERDERRALVVVCATSRLDALRQQLRLAQVEHLLAATFPDHELVDLRSGETLTPPELPHDLPPLRGGYAARGFDPLEQALPGNVERELWRQWVQHRRELGKPLTPTSTAQQLRKLEDAGARANAAIRTAIERGWRGLFPEHEGDDAQAVVPRGTFAPNRPQVEAGDLVRVHAPDGESRVVSAMVVSDANFLIDEHGDTHPWARVERLVAEAA